MKILKNKKGEVYIYLCALLLAIIMLVSVLILYMGIVSGIQIQKRDMKQKLDSYVAEYAIEAFEAVKQGEAYAKVLNTDNFMKGAYKAFGFTTDGQSVYTYPNGTCSITRPTITSHKTDGFGLTISYTLIYSLEWNGTSYTDIQIPVTLTSSYNLK